MTKKGEQNNTCYNELLSFYQLVCKTNPRTNKDIRKRFTSIKNGNIIEKVSMPTSCEIKTEPGRKENTLMNNAYENLRSQYEIIRKCSCRH